MTRYYKLTDENNQTRNGTQWGENITHKATGRGKNLCSPDVIHVYDHPLKAVMFNPIHANFTNPRIWECSVRGIVANDSLKVGVKSCTTIREIPLPDMTINQKKAFGIYCALEVYHEEKFVTWANNWLSGKDRTPGAAWAAAKAAAWATAEAAAEAAWAAAEAAAEAAWAVERAAAWTAKAAAAASADLDFTRLIKKAMSQR